MSFIDSARAATYSDGYGVVQAQLTDLDSTGAGLQLTITRAGQTFYDTNFGPACAFYTGCTPMPATYGGGAVAVRRANGTSEPDVFVHLSNGGNICCRSTVIYHYDAAAALYRRSFHVWGNAADSGPPQSLGHSLTVYFVSSDGRFRYQFGCGACTPQPIQIWRDRGGTLVDVTRSLPRLIAKDARKWLHLFFKERAVPYGADGILVAYVADEELLHRGKAAWKMVRREGAAGFLARPGSGFSNPTIFYKRLHRFLQKLGYLSS